MNGFIELTIVNVKDTNDTRIATININHIQYIQPSPLEEEYTFLSLQDDYAVAKVSYKLLRNHLLQKI